MKTQTISKKELVMIMLAQKLCTFVGFKAETEPTMNKKNNPFYGKVGKVSFVSSVVGYVYENVINNRRKKETKELELACEQFKSAGLKWGSFVDNSKCVIAHNDRHYIQNIVLKTRKPVYVWKETGKKLSVNEVAELKIFFPKKKEGGRQGLSAEKTAIIRTYCLDNIKRLNMNGTKFVVKN